MLELTLPPEHRVPLDAAEVLTNFIMAAQPGFESFQADAGSDLIYAWDILTRYDVDCGITPSAEQVSRLLVKASQLAQEQMQAEWEAHVGIGLRVAYLMMNRKLPIPDIKLKRPAIFNNLLPEIVQYAEPYYEPL